jgi:Fe-S-cluster-containing dehydrogenase component
MEYALIVNTKDCVGCNACEVACKQEHNLPVGPRWIRVYPDSPREIEGKLQLRYIVTHCMHCSRPSCKDACPITAVATHTGGGGKVFKLGGRKGKTPSTSVSPVQSLLH